MPPLRTRKSDIIDTAQYYLDFYCKEQNIAQKEFSQNAIKILENYDWPENISEIQSIIRQIVTQQKDFIITANTLTQIIKTKLHQNAFSNFDHISLPLWQIEKRVIEQAILLCKGNIAQAATLLDVAPSTIYRKMKNWEKK